MAACKKHSSRGATCPFDPIFTTYRSEWSLWLDNTIFFSINMSPLWDYSNLKHSSSIEIEINILQNTKLIQKIYRNSQQVLLYLVTIKLQEKGNTRNSTPPSANAHATTIFSRRFPIVMYDGLSEANPSKSFYRIAIQNGMMPLRWFMLQM
jgi:hypothetical protein